VEPGKRVVLEVLGDFYMLPVLWVVGIPRGSQECVLGGGERENLCVKEGSFWRIFFSPKFGAYPQGVGTPDTTELLSGEKQGFTPGDSLNVPS